MFRFVKNLVFIGLLLLSLGFASAFGTKFILETKANNAAQTFINNHINDSMQDEEKIREISKAVYLANLSSQKSGYIPFLFRIQPYLVHELMPEIFRVKVGAIEALYMEGMCDSAARRLNFILDTAGYPSKQFNIVSSKTGHSITKSVLPSGSAILIDSYHGVMAAWQGKLIGPKTTKELMDNGVSAPDVWLALGPEANLEFYQNFNKHSFAEEGQTLRIEVDVDMEDHDEISLGKIDGSSHDLQVSFNKRNWSPYWTYIGHRYDRGFERILNFHQKTRVTFFLTRDANEGFITSQIPPKITQGNLIVYEIEKGRTLHFRDGLAKRDWLRLKSSQAVDKIVFEKIDS